ncbi:MAG: 5-bromo-4-chloroindolyl phosphate hydrolysis family protein [Firmicutes bacterium]|nr:5-bromo-4-chloroindolyl phosphate hydrolysis family protein [Bacillota bacterium]
MNDNKDREPVTFGETRPVTQKEIEPEYEIRRVRSTIPIYLSGAVWLVWALLLPLYMWYHFLGAAAVSGIVYLIGSRFCAPTDVRIPKHKKAQKTGDRDADKIISGGEKELASASASLTAITRIDREFAETASRVIGCGYKIIGYLSQNTAQVPLMRRFFNYYLPTLGKLLRSYVTFASHGADGKNVTESMKEIKDAVGAMENLFLRQLDKMFFDTALDISTDIDVLEAMLAKDSENQEI